MKCPQCSGRVPLKILWTVHGAEALTCPRCRTSLCPRAGCAVALFLLACLTGDAAMILMRRSGAESWMAVTAFIAVFAVVYLAGMRVVLRLRVSPGAPLMGHKNPAHHHQ